MEPHDIKNLKVKPPKPNAEQVRSFIGFVVVFILAIVAWNSWFTVEPEEVGLVLRFGKYVREAKPGLNFKLPAPVETVIKVPVQRQLKEEFGFRTVRPGMRTSLNPRSYDSESLMLTGDLNVAVVEWIAQYRIREPYKFLFKVKNPQVTFRDMNEAVMREVVGNHSVNDILTTGRQFVADRVKQELQRLCDKYETGIIVEQIVLQDVTPPDPVKPSFNEVNQAQQERETRINQAKARYNKAIPKAKGEALRMIQQAEGYATDRINRAQGDAAFFNALYASYEKAPEVTRKRLFLEATDDIYPALDRKVIVDHQLKGIIPLLSINDGKLPVTGAGAQGGAK